MKQTKVSPAVSSLPIYRKSLTGLGIHTILQADDVIELSISRPKGSDCGVVNVNIPTNGAEIGGAFGESYIM